MENSREGYSQLSLFRKYVPAALLIFLVPALSLAFFWRAQSQYNTEAREELLKEVQNDAQIPAEGREELLHVFSEVPLSTLVQDPEFAKSVDETVLWEMRAFRWLILMSLGCLVGGVLVVALVGFFVVLSLRSPRAQVLGLSLGWQVMKIFGALQTIAQGIMLLALSYWVTALWFNVYVPKLIFIAGFFALFGIIAVIRAIFRNPKVTNELEGVALSPEQTTNFRAALEPICAKVGAAMPDNIIAGIDDNFFVTEHPVMVDNQEHRGKTLFVSLALLKQLPRGEVEAVLAHEMAHFSGGDTTYSRQIAPVVMRFDHYLSDLYQGGMSAILFHFMLAFRALYEVSLGKLSRQREFRADNLAAEVASPENVAKLLLRISAYSEYRNAVQQKLFDEGQVLERADISDQVEQGFGEFLQNFANRTDLGDLETSHPFDSHPPLRKRLAAVQVEITPDLLRHLANETPDEKWYYTIKDAASLERTQWDAYEARFKQAHEEVLAFRYLPATDAEREHVVKFFPPLAITGKEGDLQLDFASIMHPKWPDAVQFEEVTGMSLNENNLCVNLNRDGNLARWIALGKFGPRQNEALEAINRYYGRYKTALQLQQQEKNAVEGSA
jgi:Zn-dependent protease with chaperone function